MDKKQLKLLKKIKKSHLFDITDFSQDDMNIIRYLMSQKYVCYKSDLMHNEKRYCQITEQGKSFLSQTYTSTFRFWVPIIISNILSTLAIIISIIALLK